MADTKIIDVETIKRRVMPALGRAATELGKEIYQEYVIAINKFYDSYTPENGHPYRYKRTYSTYLAAWGVGGKSVYAKPNVTTFVSSGYISYEAGIIVDPSNIPGNPYFKDKPHGWGEDKLTNENIFPRTFDQGIHGFSEGQTYHWQNGEHTREDGTVVKHQASKPSAPPLKVPPPRVDMNKAFEKIASEGHIRQIIDKYVGPIIGG